VTWLAYDTRRIGAVVHSAPLLDDGVHRDVPPLLRIATERDRLYRDLVAKLEQLSASRLHILRAGDDARRLERNLRRRAATSPRPDRCPSLAARLADDPELGPHAEVVRAS
jgi:hypothetical protein